MARKIKDVNAGVTVMINPANSKKLVRITKKTRRTFSTEVNIAVEDYDPKIVKYKCDGR